MMANARGRKAMQKAKEAKQKKALFVLAPVLLALVAWQGPKTFNALTGSSSAAPPAPTATAPVPGVPLPPPGSAPVTTTPTPPAALVDTDVPAEAGDGQLSALGRFSGGDPFAGAPAAGSPADSSSGDSSGDAGTSSDSGGDVAVSSAVIEVNGKSETVNKGSAFPASHSIFTLVSLTPKKATLGLVQGLFEDGSATVDVAVGEQVVLIAAPDTTKYTVELISVS
jgi:hypothetical protein